MEKKLISLSSNFIFFDYLKEISYYFMFDKIIKQIFLLIFYLKRKISLNVNIFFHSESIKLICLFTNLVLFANMRQQLKMKKKTLETNCFVIIYLRNITIVIEIKLISFLKFLVKVYTQNLKLFKFAILNNYFLC